MYIYILRNFKSVKKRERERERIRWRVIHQFTEDQITLDCSEIFQNINVLHLVVSNESSISRGVQSRLCLEAFSLCLPRSKICIKTSAQRTIPKTADTINLTTILPKLIKGIPKLLVLFSVFFLSFFSLSFFWFGTSFWVHKTPFQIEMLNPDSETILNFKSLFKPGSNSKT